MGAVLTLPVLGLLVFPVVMPSCQAASISEIALGSVSPDDFAESQATGTMPTQKRPSSEA